MSQYFWKRWSDDVLNQWQMRTKWQREGTSPELNDMVLIKDENLPPAQWLLGRVTDTYPGDDGLVRVATVQTQGGIRKRPITKLCALTKNQNDFTDAISEDEKVTVNIAKISHVNKRKSVSVLPLITAILAVFVTASHGLPIASKPFEISHFQSSPGLFFGKAHGAIVSAIVSYDEEMGVVI